MSVELFIAILVIALVVWICFWIVDSIGFPSPISVITKAIIGIVGVLAILTKSGLM